MKRARLNEPGTPGNGTAVHLVGMGGIGMSAVAQILLARGAEVSGSDEQNGPLLQKIRRLGGKVKIGHAGGNLDHPDWVVYSSSISPRNPELVAARNRKIPVIHRGQILARLLEKQRTIAVTGSHGKSTTAAMIGSLLAGAGLDPTLALGAEVDALGGNARSGRGPHAVVEADESDGSFLWLRPAVGVITNVDEEHLDYFRNRWEIEEAYRQFADRVLPEGALIGCSDDPSVFKLLNRSGRERLGYGLREEARIRAVEVSCGPGGSRYRCLRDGRPLGEVLLKVPGIHNVVNSLAAVAAAEVLRVPFSTAQKSLEKYRGAGRRFQVHGEGRGVLVVEDYGHHPAEIEATLEAAAGLGRKRTLCLFQPHRYSRTLYLRDRFASCFKRADELLLLPIYAASEEPVEPDADGKLFEALRAAGQKRVVRVASGEEALERMTRSARPGDVALFLGAGNVGALAGKWFRNRSSSRKRGSDPRFRGDDEPA